MPWAARTFCVLMHVCLCRHRNGMLHTFIAWLKRAVTRGKFPRHVMRYVALFCFSNLFISATSTQLLSARTYVFHVALPSLGRAQQMKTTLACPRSAGSIIWPSLNLTPYNRVHEKRRGPINTNTKPKSYKPMMCTTSVG